MRRLGWYGLVAVLAGAPGCSFLLDFDGTITDAAPAPPDASPYEPNDTFAAATAIECGKSYGPVAIDPAGDRDLYTFTLAAPRGVAVDLLFAHADGDLDVVLWTGAGLQIAASADADDNERIVHAEPLVAGDYVVEVHGHDAEVVCPRYSLLVSLL
jgi:hypothetical protein